MTNRLAVLLSGALFGFFIGFILGVLALVDIVPVIVALPMECLAPVWWPFFSKDDPLALILGCTINALGYAIVGTLAGHLCGRNRWQTSGIEHQVPDCPICGFKNPSVDSSTCPQCGRANAFSVFDAGHRFRCGQCKYELTGNMSGVCPECGEVI